MHERIAQRLADIKAQHAAVLEELTQVEQRREYLLQAALRLGGALAVLEELAPPLGTAPCKDADDSHP